MKILQLIMSRQLRGAEIFTCHLSNHLLKLGHEVTIISLRGGSAQLPFNGKIETLGEEPISFYDRSRMKALSEMIVQKKPDVIQANAGDTVRLAVFSKLAHGWKTPLIFRNASTVSLYIKNPVVKWMYSLLYRRVDYIISVSHFSRNDFVQMFPSTVAKIEVVPVGIEEDKINSGVYIKNPSENYLVHVGGFTFEKNHVGLLSIFRKALMRFPKLRLVLVGDGPLRGQIENTIHELGIEQHVRFMGYQHDPLPFIASAKALLLPSIIEGLPAVVIEAMFLKTPVISYEVGGVGEIVQHNKTGWLVRKGDEEGFVKAIGEVLDKPHDAEKLSHQAYELVKNDFTNSAVSNRFLKIYERVLTSG